MSYFLFVLNERDKNNVNWGILRNIFAYKDTYIKYSNSMEIAVINMFLTRKPPRDTKNKWFCFINSGKWKKPAILLVTFLINPILKYVNQHLMSLFSEWRSWYGYQYNLVKWRWDSCLFCGVGLSGDTVGHSNILQGFNIFIVKDTLKYMYHIIIYVTKFNRFFSHTGVRISVWILY